ncbi:MAG: ATPase, T2SS/T4P/T4SS family [Pseudomonadota bacterium]|nr:ATPase, T2SS/T4P/T4SS family [Pseudomonadota bacterium]
MTNLSNLTLQIQEKINGLPITDVTSHINITEQGIHDSIKNFIHQLTLDKNREFRGRLESEFFSNGPLDQLITDDKITEIIIYGHSSIWFEKLGTLIKYEDTFLTPATFHLFTQKLYHECGINPSSVEPFARAQWQGFRVQIVVPPISEQTIVQLRKLNPSTWSLTDLENLEMVSSTQHVILSDLIRCRKNFIIIGATGSGKTTLLNSVMVEVPPNERVIIIEDTNELRVPNLISAKLVSRPGQKNLFDEIGQVDLVKESLRLRPDRLVVGEVRGGEAKDLLMALATGHSGSLGTLHADNPNQALIRLEMLIQMGAPQWSLQAIRRLIFLSLQNIVQVRRSLEGRRVVEGIFKISSLEDFGFLLEKIDT